MLTRKGVDVGSQRPTALGRAAMPVYGVTQAASVGVMGSLGTWAVSLIAGDLAEENEALKGENATLREEKARLIGVLQEKGSTSSWWRVAPSTNSVTM